MKTRLLLPALFIFTAVATFAVEPGKRLVVHEWGTFTSLQDEAGESIGGINTEDEPVPEFVRRLAYGFLLSPSEAPPVFFQGAPRCHPDVKMRLETPVIYFYPVPGAVLEPFDVRVAFHGGWLTEFYPAAEAKAPGFDAANPNRVFAIERDERMLEFEHGFGHLRPEGDGELWWKGVKLGADGTGPETKENVWLAPRAVQSAMLQTAYGEREKFLFYRGVGNMHAGLRVVRNETRKILEIRDEPSSLAALGSAAISAAWLVQVRGDGRCAFRSLGALSAGAQPRATVPASFAPEDFATGNLTRLHDEMRAALIASGLFADEAEALLRTWQISYFESRGLRLFYVCPAAEIERLLPLHISVPCDITRVMIGRVEMVTPRQRELLAKIAAGPSVELWTMRGVTGDSRSDFFKNPENVRHWKDVMDGKAPYRELGLPIPEIYTAYLQLGRFRNALLLDEEKRRPTDALADYIQKNLFDAYKIGTSPH